jgi:hypothetical protein
MAWGRLVVLGEIVHGSLACSPWSGTVKRTVTIHVQPTSAQATSFERSTQHETDYGAQAAVVSLDVEAADRDRAFPARADSASAP